MNYSAIDEVNIVLLERRRDVHVHRAFYTFTTTLPVIQWPSNGHVQHISLPATSIKTSLPTFLILTKFSR